MQFSVSCPLCSEESELLFPVEECVDELLVLLGVDLVALEELVEGLACLSGQLGSLLLGLILHLLQKCIEHLLVFLVEEHLLVALGLVVEGTGGEAELSRSGDHVLASSHGHGATSLENQALHIYSNIIIIFFNRRLSILK